MHTFIKINDLDAPWNRGLGFVQWLLVGLMLLFHNPLWAASNTETMPTPNKILLQQLVTELDQNGSSEQLKVEVINDFFNQVPRAMDQEVWGQKDYWATPDELLKRHMGDCEDVAIAKYFTLRDLGVSDQHLRLAYGKIVDFQRGSIEPHMVLIYMPEQGRPVVLDSLNINLISISERQDLILEYTFNIESLWRWQEKSSILLGKADVLEPWRNLLKRL